MKTSPEDVALWMADEVAREGCLYQDHAASEIEDRFGEEHVNDKDNGNLAISKAVLKAFRALTEEEVVWELSARYWRSREPDDDAGRQA